VSLGTGVGAGVIVGVGGVGGGAGFAQLATARQNSTIHKIRARPWKLLELELRLLIYGLLAEVGTVRRQLLRR
jgi:hypothetical protein